MEEAVFHWITQHGYPAIFGLLVLGIVGLPVPDETLLTFAGYLIYTNRLQVVPTFIAALGGSLCGITASYILGRTLGIGLIRRYGRYVHLTSERIAKAHNWFERVGRWALTFGYYLPGVRHLTAYAAGMSSLEPHVFALFAYTRAVLWTSTFLTLGYLLGERWEVVANMVERHMLVLAIALAAAAGAYSWWRKRKADGRPDSV